MSNSEESRDYLKWKMIKRRLGYDDEQLQKFRENPRNEDVLNKVPEIQKKIIIVGVIDSHGCNSQHRIGDKFFFDVEGNLLTELSPKKICISAMNAVSAHIFAVRELIYAGVDPAKMRFKRAACFDVGLECGGWGRVVMEIKVEDRKDS
jgi:uncharacterized repeat protein (TIGR04076 family)